MAVLNEQEFRKQLKSGQLSTVYMIYGDEPYLKKHYVEKLACACVPSDFADFNLHRFEKETPLDEILSACEALPMLSERTCVIVRDLSPEELSADAFDAFSAAVGDMPDTTVFVLWLDNVSVPARPSGKTAKLIKLFDKCGSAVEIKKRTGTSLLKPLIAGVEKRGCKIDMVTASYLVSVVGDNYNTLLNEIEKLCSYVGKGEITRQLIDSTCVKSLEASAFDLVKAIISGDADSAYKTLDKLFSLKVEPMMIMGALISTYVDMYRAKVSLANGHKPEHMAGCFNYRNKEFRLRNAARDASRLSVGQLRKSLDELAAADLTLKTQYSDAAGSRLAIEKAIVKLMLISNEE